MTRRVTLLLILLANIFALSAHAAPRPIELTVWGVTTGPETKDVYAEAAAFEKMHPDVPLSLLSMGAGQMDPQKLMTAIVGQVPPDVVYQDRFTVGDWASRGAFRQLDDLLAQDASSKSPYAVRQRDYVPATWAEAVYNGHVYAIPNSTDDRVLFYNKTDFKEAGLDPNKPPQTWDELIADAKKMTIRNPNGTTYKQIGFIPSFSQGWLYLWSWQEDGDFMSPDGRRCTMDNPQTVKALTALTDWYKELGGVDNINAFAGGFGATGQDDPFMTGELAMRIDGDAVINSIARWHPEMDFGVAPVPVPAERFRHEGRFKNDPTWVTWSGGYSYAIPVGAKHVKEAWEFIQWMNSPQAALIGAQAQAAYTRGMGRIYVPNFYPNNNQTKAVFGAFRSQIPPKFLNAKQACIDLLPVTKFRPVTFVGQTLWDEQVRATDNATRGLMSPEKALAQAQGRVQQELDAAFTQSGHPYLSPLVFPILAGVGVVGVIALLIAAGLWMARQKRAARREAAAGFLFTAPWAFGFVVFTAGPILASLVLSFCDYDVLHAARWAGWNNYHSLFTSDWPIFAKSLYNVAYLAVIGIPLGMATSLTMAMLLNAGVRGQQFYRTFFYMPSIVPVVASVVLWSYLLNSDPSRGLLNAAWQGMFTHWFGWAPPGWLAVPQWAKPTLILLGVWSAGGGMILWLAGLQSIPTTLYEAAQIDGAG
ncbi:MAG TPA: extracellular solute-binding protein, partial [Capsulimonadaceae bacterium]|nr:extracellular solute-binding protein [Capsulimonadaceae bacterium]